MKKYVVIEKKGLGEYEVLEFPNIDAAYSYYMKNRVNRIIFRKVEVTLGEKNG